jgi:prevent-host-death family protein
MTSPQGDLESVGPTLTLTWSTRWTNYERMAIQANVHEAKTHFSELLERAHNGEEVIIAKAGKPYARLVPITDDGNRQPGTFRGQITGDVAGGVGPDESQWG